MALSALELRQAANKAANKAMFDQLELGEAIAAAPKVEAPPPKPKAAPRVKRVMPPREPVVARKSSRVAGNIMDEEDLKRKREEEEEIELAEQLANKKLKHESREVVALERVTGSGTTEDLLKQLKEMAAGAQPKTENIEEEEEEDVKPKRGSPKKKASVKKEEDEEEDVKPKRGGSAKKAAASTTIDTGSDSKPRTSSISTAKLATMLKTLEMRALVKVVPERIYSLVVHPSVDRDLVFVGDKIGTIGLWDATDATEKETPKGSKEQKAEMEATDNKGRIWGWQAHGKNSIAALKLDPFNGAQIFSASYDCTVRRMNFETGASDEVIDGDTFTDEALMHGLDVTRDGQNVWSSDNAGGIHHRDMRSPIATARRWNIEENKKIGSFSLNPMNPNYAVTAHLKNNMRLLDLRMIQTFSQSKSTDVAQLATFSHGAACSSAYFDPNGTKIVSTSYDDQIRIWDFDSTAVGEIATPWIPTYSMKHNNQVGRYVSVLKTQWAANPDLPAHCHVGNMSHPLDIISGEGKLLAAPLDPYVTAVPSITASHPAIFGRYYGGTAAGKVSLFCPPPQE